MYQDYTGGVPGNGFPEYFGGTNHRCIDTADINRGNGHHAAVDVQQNHAQVFLFERFHFGA